MDDVGAMGIDAWRFCPRCGVALDAAGGGTERHLTCSACGFVKYDNPLPATIGIVESSAGELLLVRRADDPRRGLWNTVGGFLATGESAEDAMRREAREEIGVEVHVERVLATYPSVYGETGLRTLGIAFACRFPDGAEIRPSAEISEHAWFAPDALPQLAFADVAAAVVAWAEGRGSRRGGAGAA